MFLKLYSPRALLYQFQTNNWNTVNPAWASIYNMYAMLLFVMVKTWYSIHMYLVHRLPSMTGKVHLSYSQKINNMHLAIGYRVFLSDYHIV